jgi:hypothetical protein
VFLVTVFFVIAAVNPRQSLSLEDQLGCGTLAADVWRVRTRAIRKRVHYKRRDDGRLLSNRRLDTVPARAGDR